MEQEGTHTFDKQRSRETHNVCFKIRRLKRIEVLHTRDIFIPTCRLHHPPVPIVLIPINEFDAHSHGNVRRLLKDRKNLRVELHSHTRWYSRRAGTAWNYPRLEQMTLPDEIYSFDWRLLSCGHTCGYCLSCLRR